METDYLVVGAGAMGMAFTDALIDHADVHVTLVDRRHAASGHWLDAYPFVQLHQASVFYGVASMVLGTGAVQRDRARGGPAGAGPAGGDPLLLRRHPVPSLRRVGPGHVPGRARAPRGRRNPARDVAGLGGDDRDQGAQAGRRRDLPRAHDPRDDSPAVRRGRRRGHRPDQPARAARDGAGPLRDRRLGQDRDRRHHLVAHQRRRARPHHLGPPARPVDAQPRGRAARSRSSRSGSRSTP